MWGRGVGLEVGGHWGGDGARSVQGEGLDCGEERTSNMPLMVVTLEVSKLSGWLNTDPSQPPCRVEKKAYDARRGAGRETGGPRATAAQAACREGRDAQG